MKSLASPNDDASSKPRNMLWLQGVKLVAPNAGIAEASAMLSLDDVAHTSQKLSMVKLKGSKEYTWETQIILVSTTFSNFTVTLFAKEKSHSFLSKKSTREFKFLSDQFTKEQDISQEKKKISIVLILKPYIEADILQNSEGLVDSRKPWLSYIGKTCAVLDFFFTFKDLVTGIHPAVAVAVSAVSFLYEAMKNEEACHQEIIDLLENITQLSSFTDQLKLHNKNAEIVLSQTKDVILEITEFVCSFCQIVQSYKNKSHFATILGSFDDDLALMQKTFNSLKDRYSMCIQGEIHEMALQINQKMNINNILKDHISDTHYDLEKTCTFGTRTEVLDLIYKWAESSAQNDSNMKNLFWLHGIAGAGKSSIAHTIANILNDKNMLGASFFCRRDSTYHNEPKSVLPTLAFHMSQIHKGYRAALSEQLERYNLSREMSVSDQYKLLFTNTKAQNTESQTLVIVIDALDECGNFSSRRMLLESIVRMANEMNWIKVFTTSRMDYDIQMQLQVESTYMLDLFQYPADADIKKYIQEVVKLKTTRIALQLKDDMIDQLVQKSGGLFIWISTTLKFLGDRFNYKQLLTQILQGAGPAANNAEAGLNSMYIIVLQTTAGNDDNKEFVKTLLAIIVLASKHSPMPLSVVSYILPDMDADLVNDIAIRLQAVVDIDEENDNVLRIHHQSFTDFLENKNRSGEFWVDLSDIGLSLSIGSFKYMAENVHFNICNFDSSYIINSEVEDLDERIKEHVSLQLQFTCLNWMFYVPPSYNEIKEYDVKELDQLILDFAHSPQLVFWIEIFTLINAIDYLCDGLRVLWENVSKMNLKCSQNVNDIIKFVQLTREVLQQSTPHLYISALSWALPYSCFDQIKTVMQNTYRPDKLLIDMTSANPVEMLNISVSEHVWNTKFSPNGQCIASAFGDVIRIWDSKTGLSVGTPFVGHTGFISHLAYSPDGKYIVSASHDSTIIIWNASSGAPIGSPLKGHVGLVCTVTYSPDGKIIVSGSQDRTIRIWDASTGKQLGEPLKGHTDFVETIAFSPDGKYFVSGSYDETVILWNTKTREPVGEPMVGHMGKITAIAYSPDGKYFASTSVDQTIILWDVKTRNPIGEPFEGHTEWISCIAFFSSGNYLATAADDRTILIWDIETHMPIGAPLKGHTNTITSLSISQSDEYICTGSTDNTIRVWSTNMQETSDTVRVKRHTGNINSVAFSPDGKCITSGSSDKSIIIWDASTGTPIGQPLVAHSHFVTSVAYSPDGTQLVSGSNDRTAIVWDVFSQQQIGVPLKGHIHHITCVSYSSDGKTIATGSKDNTVRLWIAESHEPLNVVLQGDMFCTNCIAFSPNMKHIVSGSSDNLVRVWDISTGTAVVLAGHKEWVRTVAYSPNGKYVASGSNDDTVRLWDVDTGEPAREFVKKHTGNVTGLKFSSNGKLLISVSNDETVVIWDIRTGTPLITFEGHTDWINTVALSPDGKFIASGSNDNTIRIWSIDSDEMLENTQEGYNPLPLNEHPTKGNTCVKLAKNVMTDGWAQTENKDKILWVPQAVRSILTDYSVMCIGPYVTETRACDIGLDCTKFCYGENWIDICSV